MKKLSALLRSAKVRVRGITETTTYFEYSYIDNSREFSLPTMDAKGMYEVQEATRNPTEDALAEGGFYSQDGFPFQTCN